MKRKNETESNAQKSMRHEKEESKIERFKFRCIRKAEERKDELSNQIMKGK